MTSVYPSPNHDQHAVEPGRGKLKDIRAARWCQKRQLLAYLTGDVCEDALLEGELILLAFATGIQDATTYPDYGCFASNQTGNTVLLAVGIAGLRGTNLDMPKTWLSLGLFIAGSLVIGQVGNFLGCRRRIWLLVSNLLQTAMVFAAAAIHYWLGVSTSGPIALAVLALLAFSSGGQVAMARSLKINEIATAMATSAYVDLFVDPKLLARHNRPRNRRALFLLSLFTGSFAGAFAYSRISSPFALLLSALGKLIVTITFLFNRCIKTERVNTLD